jgi:sigma-B regulation protein RsbU (phosphoserine phosphatase)
MKTPVATNRSTGPRSAEGKARSSRNALKSGIYSKSLIIPGEERSRQLNRHFFDSTASERFATVFFGLYDDRTRKLRDVNCGHVAPLLLRDSGRIEQLGPTATMLGAFSAWNCAEAMVELQPRDALILYSDGVTEARIDHREEFGEDRLIRTVCEHQRQTAGILVQKIVDAVSDFSGTSRSDDVTVVALRGI